MASSALVLAIFGVLCFNMVTAINVTHCFRCTSPGNPECDDEFDITRGESIQCDSLIYLRKLEQPTDLMENVIIRERASNTTVFQFYCVKLAVEYKNGTSGIVRSCHQHPDNVAEVCDFIRIESIAGLTSQSNVSSIASCDVCNDGNNCNSATSIYTSIVTIFLAALLAKSC